MYFHFMCQGWQRVRNAVCDRNFVSCSHTSDERHLQKTNELLLIDHIIAENVQSTSTIGTHDMKAKHGMLNLA